MSTGSETLFVSRRKSVHCNNCRNVISEGEYILSSDEKKGGLCKQCAHIDQLVLLPPGDRAMTVRSKKFSSRTVVVQAWNNRKRRYERKGQFVDPAAIELAKQSCLEDSTVRSEKNKKAAVKRKREDEQYRRHFARAIRDYFPGMPPMREYEIAEHACEKYSGRVGRTAQAKEFDPDMITRAVIAHIRHSETSYDSLFGKGLNKREIRSLVKPAIVKRLNSWRVVEF